MPEIVVTVKNKMAVGDGSVIVCNNSDYVVRFVLDSEWDALALRTMRIVYDSYTHTDIAFSGDTVALPTIIDRTSIGIGLYSGDIHTSTCAMFDCERSVMGKNSHAVEPPSSDVYNEIVEMINDGRLKGDKGDKGDPGARGYKGDKGDKGDPGAPGKDGSDATVTAENIEAALGYAPVTPSDLAAKQDVLTDADKQSITKIGMTTGAAWTSVEQKAARERMGIPGGYELIEEITIAEGNVSVITRDVDRLCSVKLVIICPPMESIITANALIFFGDASKPEYIYLFGEIAPTKVGVYRHTTLEAELRNNYWRAYKTAENDTGNMYPNGFWTTLIAETAPSRLMQLPSSNLDAITKITLNAYPRSAHIPVGTKITIYGVRA